LGMMYFTTGNASPREGSLPPGDNLFTASFVALDYRTGQYKGHFPQMKTEIWDYDLPNPPVLFDQMYNGQMRKGVYQAAKTGWLYFLDRTNGQPLIGMDYKAHPADLYPGASEKQHASPAQPTPVANL